MTANAIVATMSRSSTPRISYHSSSAANGHHPERRRHEELVGHGIDHAPERRAAEPARELAVEQVAGGGRGQQHERRPWRRTEKRRPGECAPRSAGPRSSIASRPCSPFGRGLVSDTLLLSLAGAGDRGDLACKILVALSIADYAGYRGHPLRRARHPPSSDHPLAAQGDAARGVSAVLHWALDEAADAGLLRAIIVTNPHKPMLEAAARSYEGPLELEFVPQDHPRGLGDALLRARDHLAGSPFLALLPDNLFLGPNPTAAVLATHRSTGLATVLLAEISREQAADEGRHRPRHGGAAGTARSG